MKIGYARVSTQDQNLDLQINDLTNFGCELIYKEKLSGKDKERPELNRLLNTLRKGDTVIVWKLDRLGRSLKDLIDIVAELNNKGVDFISIKDSINTGTATGRFTFNIFASLAEFEREIIQERTMAGLAAAKLRGKTGGRPQGLSKSAISKAKSVQHLFRAGKSMTEISKELNIGRATCYRYLEHLQGIQS